MEQHSNIDSWLQQNFQQPFAQGNRNKQSATILLQQRCQSLGCFNAEARCEQYTNRTPFFCFVCAAIMAGNFI